MSMMSQDKLLIAVRLYSENFKIPRRLATANRSRISVRCRPFKIFLTFTFITIQNLVVVSYTERTHVSPKIWETLGPYALGIGV